ncbi:hypothetical protein BURPS406E_D1051 [Burkholderia pseudomallei 406e]|nr:hypothetical protein BURPS406E_D1051 [Burkholderia pseudomallei 406e]
MPAQTIAPSLQNAPISRASMPTILVKCDCRSTMTDTTGAIAWRTRPNDSCASIGQVGGSMTGLPSSGSSNGVLGARVVLPAAGAASSHDPDEGASAQPPSEPGGGGGALRVTGPRRAWARTSEA